MRTDPILLTRGYPTGNVLQQANTINTKSLIYRATVPRNEYWAPNRIDPMVLLLAFAETITLPGDHSLEDTTYPICRVPEIDDSAAVDGLYQLVELSADGTVRTITEITDHIDGATGQVKCSDETNAAHCVSYIPKAAGEIIVAIEVPGSQGIHSKNILRRSIGELHAANQERDGGLNIEIPLPENFSIAVYLNAPWTVAFASLATGGVSDLPFCRIELPVVRGFMSDLAEPGEPSLGYNAAQRAIAHIAGFPMK